MLGVYGCNATDLLMQHHGPHSHTLCLTLTPHPHPPHHRRLLPRLHLPGAAERQRLELQQRRRYQHNQRAVPQGRAGRRGGAPQLHKQARGGVGGWGRGFRVWCLGFRGYGLGLGLELLSYGLVSMV